MPWSSIGKGQGRTVMSTQITRFTTSRLPYTRHASDDSGSIVNEQWRTLLALGFQPAIQRAGQRISATGAGFSWPVRTFTAAPEQLAPQLERVRSLLLSGVAVTLTLNDAGAGSSRRIERLLRKLRRAVVAPCIDSRLLGLAVAAEEMPLPAFLLMSKILLGQGPRYVVLEAAHLDRGGLADASPAWTALYQQRTWRWGLRPVYGGDSRTRCPLLSDEQTPALSSANAIRVPVDSAWLCLELFVCRFANRHGQVDNGKLQAALQQALDTADQLFDHLHWCDREQRRDAASNRRIGFVLQGIGDLVLLRGADPADIECLRYLDRLIAGIHECLWDRSRCLASSRGLLPALAARDPSRGVAAAEQRRNWQSRWHAALASVAVRHRNLLVMSPYSVMPQSGAGDRRDFADLLPLLAHADACSFAPAMDFSGWSISEFKNFHCRAHAILQRRNAATFVAAGA